MHSSRIASLALVSALLTSAMICAQEIRGPVDPFDVRSPSGEYTLHVDPDSPYAHSGATYRLSHGSDVLWTKSLHYTLRHVEVAEDGSCAGAAEAWIPAGECELVLILLGPDGAARFESHLAQNEPQYIHGPQFPWCRGIVAVPQHDLVVFRVQHSTLPNPKYARVNGEYEEWRVVRWSDGSLLATGAPTIGANDERSLSGYSVVRPIAGAPLLVCHGLLLNYESFASDRGAVFAVVDLRGVPIWEARYPRDYEAGGDRDAADRLWSWAAEHGALLEVAEPRRFAIALAAEKQRVTLEASASADGAWSIREVGRDAYEPPLEELAEEPPRPAEAPLRLQHLGSIRIQSAAAPTAKISRFDVDDRGRLGAVVHSEYAHYRFVLYAKAGERLAEVPLELGIDSEHSGPIVTWLKGDRWIVTVRTYGEAEQAFAWWLDLPAGKLMEIAEFEGDPIVAADGTFDGGFVALTQKSAPFTIVNTLSAFDAEARLRWQVVEAYGHSEGGLFSPEAVAASPTGEIGVLDNIKHAIQIFDREGVLQRTIDLDAAFGRKLSYPTELGVESNGDWVVRDFHGEPPVLRVSREGQSIAGFAPKHADGRAFQAVDGVRCAPGGELWTSDGYALLRLDAEGKVDRVVGEPPRESDLGEVECATIDHTGRILFADRRTRAIHVFDSAGKPTALHRIDTAGIDETTELECIAVDRVLGVHVALHAQHGMEDVHRLVSFHADGQARDREAIAGVHHFQLGSGRRWEIGREHILLHDAFHTEMRRHARTPDDRWLSWGVESAVARDGTLVVACRGRYHLFAPSGEPLRSLEAPHMSGSSKLALSPTRICACRGEELWCTDLASGATSKAMLGPELTRESETAPFWREDEGELWILDYAGKQVLRYRIAS